MNTELNNASQCYGLYNNENEIVGFCAIIHQPHNRMKNLKRVHRLVILPDYQGVGLGTKFLNIIAEYYKTQGHNISIVTSAKNMIASLYKSGKWRLTSKIDHVESRTSPNGISELNKTIRKVDICGRFMYK